MGVWGRVCVCVRRGGGGCFLLETVNLISQHSSRNRKSNSVRAALSISCLAAQVDKCTAELIYSAHILDAPTLGVFCVCVFLVFFLVTGFFIYLFFFSGGGGPVVRMSGSLISAVLI